ncbi:hypothetical protein D3C81_2320080 [compost metagenome]
MAAVEGAGVIDGDQQLFARNALDKADGAVGGDGVGFAEDFECQFGFFEYLFDEGQGGGA